MKNIYKFIAASVLVCLAMEASAKSAMCSISTAGKIDFSGKCNFIADENGTFALSALKRNSELYDGILVVTVNITSKNSEAQVYGLTREGVNSRWGKAIRDKTNLACWKGNKFKVCAK